MNAGTAPAAAAESNPRSPPVHALPCRLSADGRVATWNPALTYDRQVTLRVRLADGRAEERPTLNSGRARVRDGERIESLLAGSLLDG